MDSASASNQDAAELARLVNNPSIAKTALQTICSQTSLSRTGNKSDLQARIVSLCYQCVGRRDHQRFAKLRQSIFNNCPGVFRTTTSMAAGRSQPTYGRDAEGPSYAPISSVDKVWTNGYAPSANGHRVPHKGFEQSFAYKESPFYNIVDRIGEVSLCDVMAQHRHSVILELRATDNAQLAQCGMDPTMKVMLFCAGMNTGLQDIAFPHQCELKVNGGDIKANMRGLKNKPGSTRPVDITDSLRLKPPTYTNNIEFIYALTQKKYYFGIYVCKVTPTAELAERIRRGKKIPKQSVALEIAKKNSDPDVVATSQNLSLKCPLSYMRLILPCRGVKCNHVSCFDATSYLQLQEQGPQWLCPICNNSAPFDQLAVDEYVMDILTCTSKSLEQVTIEPDGRWAKPSSKIEGMVKNEPSEASFVDEDEISEIPSLTAAGPACSTPTMVDRSFQAFGTPMTVATSRECLSTFRIHAGTKRPAAEVIDLTLSDDDDPAPPLKRPNLGSGMSSWSSRAD